MPRSCIIVTIIGVKQNQDAPRENSISQVTAAITQRYDETFSSTFFLPSGLQDPFQSILANS
jgi:hypothetical protein